MATMTCPTEGSQLATFLQQAYHNAQGEFPHSSSAEVSIRIDDRERSDVGSHFCSMSVLIGNTNTDRFTLFLKNPPLDDDLTELIRARDGKITDSHPRLVRGDPSADQRGGLSEETGQGNPSHRWKRPDLLQCQLEVGVPTDG